MRKYIVLLVLALGLLSFSACNSKTSTNSEITKNEQAKNEDVTLTVQGLCEMCKERIENAAKSVDGVSSADWNMDTKELQLSFDPAKTNVDSVSKSIANVGYDTDKYKAEDATYNALPACCQYR